MFNTFFLFPLMYALKYVHRMEWTFIEHPKESNCDLFFKHWVFKKGRNPAV